MKKGLVITLPRHDDVTEYLSQFSYSIEQEADEQGINIKKLRNGDANRKELEKVVKKLDYQMIVFNGHGSESIIAGNKNVPLVEVGVNEHILTERIIYARACHAALVLGKECMKENKEGCFIGYQVEFMFYMDNRWVANPLKDNTARLFLEPSNLVATSLLKGNSAKKSDENSKTQILKNINRILRNRNEESYLIATALWNNYIGQVIVGNDSATLI